MQTTTFLGLNKPEDNDVANIAVLNENADVLDAMASEVSEKLEELEEGVLGAMPSPVYTNSGEITLSDYKTSGIYSFGSGCTFTDIPIGVNGWLIVLTPEITNTKYVKQIWLRWGTANSNSFDTYERAIYEGVIGEWVQYITTKHLGASTTSLTHGGTGTVGSSTKVARQDHTHTLPALINNLTSTSTTQALAANQGKVLNEAITGLKAVATTSANGLMSSTDKSKLDKMETGDNWLSASNESNTVKMGVGSNDVYMCNTNSGKYLQLKDDGTLKYANKEIYHAGNKPAPLDIGAMPSPVYTNSGEITLSDYKTSGIYSFGSGCTFTDIPTGVNGWLIVLAPETTNTTYIKQIWLRWGTATSNSWYSYERLITGSTIGEWVRYITQKDVVNSLTSTSTAVPLSAYQGKVLNEAITKLSEEGINVIKSIQRGVVTPESDATSVTVSIATIDPTKALVTLEGNSYYTSERALVPYIYQVKSGSIIIKSSLSFSGCSFSWQVVEFN